MSVSAGSGGTTLVGVVVGGAASQTGDSPTTAATSLPFTGASDIMIMVAIAMVLLIAGVLAIGLARRSADGTLH